MIKKLLKKSETIKEQEVVPAKPAAQAASSGEEVGKLVLRMLVLL